MTHREPKPPAPYAATTKVPVAKTRVEIETLLERIGCTQRGCVVDDTEQRAVVGFVLAGAKYRIEVPLPTVERRSILTTGPAIDRVLREHQQATRSRWRGVLLLLKAKVEAVRLGLSSYEKEFMADLVLPNGHTVQEALPVLLNNGWRGPVLPEKSHG